MLQLDMKLQFVKNLAQNEVVFLFSSAVEILTISAQGTFLQRHRRLHS